MRVYGDAKRKWVVSMDLAFRFHIYRKFAGPGHSAGASLGRSAIFPSPGDAQPDSGCRSRSHRRSSGRTMEVEQNGVGTVGRMYIFEPCASGPTGQ